MSLPKIFAFAAIFLFSVIGVTAAWKKMAGSDSAVRTIPRTDTPIEVPLETAQAKEAKPVKLTSQKVEKQTVKKERDKDKAVERALPHADRIAEFFNKAEPKLPIVETITYRSRVPWQKGRPAWLSDYATYYSTSRHFIARSLNGKADYFKQDVAEGDRFNVLKPGKNINFYLLIDTSRCKMWFYYLDLDTNERVLIKDYAVGLGREDTSKPSGLLTPLGKYSLGSKIAIYKPKMTGLHNGQKVEMVRVFGSRWIPFDKEISDTTAPAKGFGLHGTPWKANAKGDLVEDSASLGSYSSDGCVRLATQDIEELFAILITRPTQIELVKDFYQAKLPGIEK